MNPTTSLATTAAPQSLAAMSMFQSVELFELVQRQADYIAGSDMIPKEYRGKPQNCAIAIEIASRLGASYFMIMQSMDVIHGRPSWRAQFLIGMVNSCGRFGPLQFDVQVTGPEKTVAIEYVEKEGFGPAAKSTTKKLNYTYVPTTCYAYATSKVTGEVVKGPSVSYDMAIQEGWVAKAGSKWLTAMRELMLTYRAGSFFARVHASDITLGMNTSEEARDMGPYIEVEATVTNAPSNAAPRNPYSQNADETPQPTRQTRAPRGAAKQQDAPAAAAPAQAPAAAAAPARQAAAARGTLAYYESVDVKTGVKDGKEWKKYTLNYSIPDGPCKQAATFSDSILAPLENAEEGIKLRIETTPAKDPRYADTLTWLEVVPEEGADQPAASSEQDDIPY